MISKDYYIIIEITIDKPENPTLLF